MTNHSYLRHLIVVSVAAFIFSACSKTDKLDPIEDSGQTIVKLIDGGVPGIRKVAIDFVNTPISLTAADIRRDIPDNAALAKTMTVIIKDDTAAVRAASLTLLPEAWYTINDATPKTGGSGGTYTVTLAPGEFAKQITINIPDATVLDPGVTYGLGFTIMSSDAESVIGSARTLVLEIGAKNIFDGRYKLRGSHSRPTLTDPYEEEIHLITTGANSVKMFWPALGQDAHPIHGGTTYYSNFTTQFFFDISANTLVNVQNPFNPATTVFSVGPANSSRYDASSKIIYAQYYYNNNLERMFTDTLIYLGSR